MTDSLTLNNVLGAVRPLIEAGAALHWLVTKDKMPVEKEWSTAPRYDEEKLQNLYQRGNNIGLRTGEPSKIGDLYLHVLDVDIRKSEKASEAWAMVAEMLPDYKSYPSVISGSGGESRHIYFLCAEPLRSKKLRKSSDFEMIFDKRKGRDVKKYDWEVDLKGTGTQLVLPPSIHPDTGKPYIWERPLDLELPFLIEVDVQTVVEWGARVTSSKEPVDSDDLFALVRAAPLDIEDEKIERILEDLPEDWVEDRDHWYRVGMALHHQYQGDEAGLQTWNHWAKQSDNFDEVDSKRVWASFHGSENPIRLPSLIQAANNNRLLNDLDLDFDDPFETDDFADDVDSDDSDLDLSALLDDGEKAPLTQPKKRETIKSLLTPDPDWTQKLHRTEEGELKNTLPNIVLIIKNDPRLSGIMAFNQFSQEVVVKNTPRIGKKKRDSSYEPVNLTGDLWKVRDELNGNNWTDNHDADIRHLIECKSQLQGYGIKISDRDLKAAIDKCAQQNFFHPVKNKILEVEWDGTPRCETLFIDYLGTEDSPYYRQAALLTLVGAVARIFEPGSKFDFVPILEGTQGKGKSTFIKILGLDWMNELQGDVGDGKQMVEAMQGSWILEIGELSSMHKAEVNDLKSFLTRTVDKVRLAYERRARDFPRQCIFIGSTNDQEYLRDQTGGRRFWPIVCDLEGQIDNPRLRRNILQIWAEAYTIYERMREDNAFGDLPLFMTDAAASGAEQMQESRRLESAEEVMAGQIKAWLDEPIGAQFDDLDPNEPKNYRDSTCIAQVWQDMMEREGSPPQMESIRIGKALGIVGWKRTENRVMYYQINKKYGKCRVYIRPGANVPTI